MGEKISSILGHGNMCAPVHAREHQLRHAHTELHLSLSLLVLLLLTLVVIQIFRSAPGNCWSLLRHIHQIRREMVLLIY